MKYIILLLLATSQFVFARQLTKVNTVWNGGTWNDGTSNITTTPTVNDTVIISSNCTIANGTNAVCKKLEITAGTITVSDISPIVVGGNFSMTGGRINLGGSSANNIPFPTVSGTISLTGGTVSYAANTPLQEINTTPTYFILNINRNTKSISTTLNITNTLSFSTSATLTTTANINLAGRINGTGTLVLGASNTLDIKGSIAGTITLTCAPTSTVIYSGSSTQTGKATVYGNLIKNGTANLLIITGSFSAEKLQILTGSMSISDGIILNSGDIEVANGTTLSISGSFPTGYGSLNFGSTSTINYTGIGNIAPITYENLRLTGATRNAIGNTTVNGNLALNNASYLTLAVDPFKFTVVGNISVSGSGTSTIDSNDGYLSIGGSFTTAITFITSTSSTVEYSGSSASQNIVAEQYNNLVLSGSANKTFVGTILIDGNLTSTTSGTVSMGTSTIEFNSANDGQFIPGFSYYKLTVSNAYKVLSGSVIVNRLGNAALTLNGTYIKTGTDTIRILRNTSDAILITDPSTEYIVGNLSRNFANGTTTLPFPMGDATLGSIPMQVQITTLSIGGGTLVSNGFLTVSSTVTNPSTYPGFAGATFISTNNACNRYWTISNSGLTFNSLRAGLRFFNPEDLGSAVTDALNFLCRVQKSGIWSNGTLPSIESDTATVSGLTLTSGNTMDIWLGELNSTLCASKVATGNWNSALSWTCNKIPTSADSVIINLGDVITLNSTSNVARYLQIDGTAELANDITVGNIGSGGILISSTGALTRTAGTPILSTTGNLVINTATTIPSTLVLAMAGSGDSLKTNQISLSIPRLTINSGLIYNTIPNLTVNTDLGSNALSNVLKQTDGTILTTTDASSAITIDASASNTEVIYNRASAQTINIGTYNKLTLTSTTAAAKTTSFPTGITSVIVNNELNLETGSAISHGLTIALTTTSLNGAGAIFNMGANTSLNLGVNSTSAAVAFPSTFTTYTFDPTSTVNYNTNGAQAVSGTPTYQNLNITTGTTNAIKTLSGNVTVSNTLTIANGVGTATLSLGTNTLNIAGTISGSGTLSCPTNSTVNYNSASAQAINLVPSYYNFTTSGAGTKTIPTGTLSVAGSLTTNGTLDAITNNTTVNLNGASGSQSISGANTFYNLNKTGASTIGSVSGMQTINNLMSISSGSGLISSNGNITIIDGASLLDNNSTSSFTPGSEGYIVVQKSAASTNKSYLLSGPISSYTATTLDAGQGKQVLRYDSDGIPLNIGTVYTNTCSPALKQNGAYTGLYKNTTGALEVGRGYSVLQASPKNLSFVGNVNNGDITFPTLSTIDRTIPDGSGYNWCAGTNGLAILGNPYPSAIDWALVYASANGINTSVKIWNGTNYTDVSQSDPILANRAIKTGQGFILQVSNFASNSLTFQNSQRISTNNGSLLRTESPISNIKIELTDTQNEDYKDVLTINFNEKATDGFDPQYDSYDLPGISDVPSLVAVVNGNELSTTEFPSPVENKQLPVILTINNASDYEVKVTNSASIPNNMKAYLVDNSKKIEYDLSETSVIPFKQGSFSNYEVQLRTSETQNVYTSVASNSNKVYSMSDKIIIENNNENLSDIIIYDVTGKMITTRSSISKGKYEIELNTKNQTQLYIVKLSSNTSTDTYKVILY